MSATSFRENDVQSITTGVSSLPPAVLANESALVRPGAA